MVGVDIGIEKLHAVFNQSVPLTHGKSVDVGGHGGFYGNPVFPEHPDALPHPFHVDIAVQKVVKVQISGGNPHFPAFDKLEELLLFLLGGGFQKFLHAVIGFAVPAEIPVLGIPHQADRRTDVVNLAVNDVLLQIRVADVGVGMVDNIKGFDFACHLISPI